MTSALEEQRRLTHCVTNRFVEATRLATFHLTGVGDLKSFDRH